ncbi:MAG: helix-turn-helix domain-containing protein, partial [Mycobacterium sp.]
MRVKTVKDLGNLVHDRRKALGMTQAELATRVGVSRLWVNQVESGHGGAAVAKVLQL